MYFVRVKQLVWVAHPWNSQCTMSKANLLEGGGWSDGFARQRERELHRNEREERSDRRGSEGEGERPTGGDGTIRSNVLACFCSPRVRPHPHPATLSQPKQPHTTNFMQPPPPVALNPTTTTTQLFLLIKSTHLQ